MPPIHYKTKYIEMVTKETDHGQTKCGSPKYIIIHYGLHGFNLCPWDYNAVANWKM